MFFFIWIFSVQINNIVLVDAILDQILIFFPHPQPPIFNILYKWSGTCGQFELCSFMFFIKSSKSIIFSNVLLYCYICLISSFSHTRSLLIPYAYVFVKWFKYILSSWLELKVILLIFTVKALSLSLLNFR